MPVKIVPPDGTNRSFREVLERLKTLIDGIWDNTPRYLVVPDWFAETLYLPKKRSFRPHKQRLKKKFRARARRAFQERPETATGISLKMRGGGHYGL